MARVRIRTRVELLERRLLLLRSLRSLQVWERLLLLLLLLLLGRQHSALGQRPRRNRRRELPLELRILRVRA